MVFDMQKLIKKMVCAKVCMMTSLLLIVFDTGAVTQIRDMDAPCSDVYAYKGLAYFCAKHELYGEELHVTNGQEFGTRVVKDVLPGVSDSRPSNFFVYREKLMFSACDASGRHALWSTNGTEAGTRKIDVLVPSGTGASCRFPIFLSSLGEMGGNFYFASRRDVYFLSVDAETLNKVELPNPRSNFLKVIKLGNELFVFVDGATSLYKIDQQGHVQIAFETGGAKLASMVIWGGRFFYSVFSSDNKLWMTNGTLSGTELVRRVDNFGENYRVVGTLGSELVIYDPVTFALYTTTDLIDFDLIASPTAANIVPYPDLRDETKGNFGRYAVFDLRYKSLGATYITDGTANGTFEANTLAKYSNRLIFEAYATRGKLSSLDLNFNSVQTFEVSRNVQNLSRLTPSSQGVFFFAYPSDGATADLWVSTGTRAGTKFIKRFDRPPGFNRILIEGSEDQRFYFSLQRLEGDSGLISEFWHSDGTSKGTNKLRYRFDDGIIPLTEEELERMRRSASMVPVIELLMDEEE